MTKLIKLNDGLLVEVASDDDAPRRISAHAVD